MVIQQVTLLQSQLTPHGLSSGTPIKINGISSPEYNISTKVASILAEHNLHIFFHQYQLI